MQLLWKKSPVSQLMEELAKMESMVESWYHDDVTATQQIYLERTVYHLVFARSQLEEFLIEDERLLGKR